MGKTRREQEIEDKKGELENVKQKNKMVQDKVEEQIASLQKKLVELKTEHEHVEENCQAVIESLHDKLTEVESSLSKRMEAYGEEREVDIYPSAPEEGTTRPQSPNLYPSLTNIPRSNPALNIGATDENKNGDGSLGSSPQISLNSSSSSRSHTPRIDSDSSV